MYVHLRGRAGREGSAAVPEVLSARDTPRVSTHDAPGLSNVLTSHSVVSLPSSGPFVLRVIFIVLCVTIFPRKRFLN